MKVLICGSRDWKEPSDPWNNPRSIEHRVNQLPNGTEVIHGAAQGADLLGAMYSALRGFKITPFPADWDRYGRKAGLMRNIEMLEEKPDLVLAFQRNKSRGTQHTIDEAHHRKIPVEVISQSSIYEQKT